ncbi:hypothetical protein [Paraflavitalea speifideaquila]|uniref:hypothetical protein n=1 Tax=Paraflavitalea speifideaquila TaxID=3076558 RepID=UPI0028EC89FD|nr:hypothetical protein [Paraflavitalea speifideiaquila]
MITGNYLPLLAGYFIGWCIIGAFAKQVNQQHSLLGKKQSILDQYAAILRLFSGINTANATLLQREQATAAAAHQAIKNCQSYQVSLINASI